MKRLIESLHIRGERGKQKGTIGYILAWMLGIPVPILILIGLLLSCA